MKVMEIMVKEQSEVEKQAAADELLCGVAQR